MNSRKFICIIVSLFCFLFFSFPAHGQVEVHVDRNRIALDETLTLFIVSEGSSFSSQLDLSALEQDFKILSRNQSSKIQIINGQTSSSTEWRVTLSPKRSGEITILSLSIGKNRTKPLKIVVDKETSPKTKSDNSLIFLETDVEPRTALVQSQVIYTLRVYLTGGSQIYEPEEPKIANAFIEKLSDVTYSKEINGRPYKVFERKYAIFPQQSGILEIPQITVPAAIATERRSSFFDSFGTRGKKVKLRSEGDTVQVAEKPNIYPQAVWLPADNLTIDAHWGQSPQTLKVGDSVTLTLTTTATGLLGSQLPPVSISDIEGLKMYQNKADIFNDETEHGITGTRRETIAIIATRPGSVRLPEIRIPWWNKKSNSIEYAVVTEMDLKIGGLDQQAIVEPQIENSTPLINAHGNMPEPQSVSLWWIAISTATAIAWLITLFFLIRTRRQLAHLSSYSHLSEGKPSNQDTMKEYAAFKLVKKACMDNDPMLARTALYDWARLFWSGEKIKSLIDLSRIQDASDLTPQIEKIDRVLYGSQDNTESWQGKILLDKLTEIGNRKNKYKEKRKFLTLLYLKK